MVTLRKSAVIALLCLALHTVSVLAAGTGRSQLVAREIQSKNFSQSKIGVVPTRRLIVYLPAGYDTETKRYPVVIGKFLLVAVDMTTPLGSSWYVNSPVTGNWEDFVIQELVPYVDANFRTLPSRDSRGIAGHFMGGYGAIRMAMKYPQDFGSV